jgi:hypothetical protein
MTNERQVTLHATEDEENPCADLSGAGLSGFLSEPYVSAEEVELRFLFC